MIGGVSWRGGSQEVIIPTTIGQLKMDGACILYNVIEIFWPKKNNQDKNMKALWPFQAPNGIGTIV